MSELREQINNIEKSESSGNPEDVFGPTRMDIVSVWLTSLGSIIAGAIGGLFTLLITYLFLGSIQTSSIFPYILSLVGFFAIIVTISISFIFNRLLFPSKYRQGSMIFAQMSILSIILFVLITPLYIYISAYKPDFLIFAFLFHILLNIFAASIISEILSGYRYILLSIYGSFIGFFAAAFLSVVFFLNFSPSKNALYSLIWVIIVINFVITLFRSLFEFIYYRIYTSTGTDYLGDIFSKMETEEKELIARTEKELTTF